MASLYSSAGILEILRRHGIAPLKRLGQNFLIDKNITEKIAEAAVLPGENVLEIGPGPGALTLALARRAKKVVAVEIDKGMLSVLEETLHMQENVEILHADFLEMDFPVVFREHFHGERFVVTGNLPYYITANCILKVLEAPVPAGRFTGMVQLEVAQRLAAAPGSKAYGALTASVAYFGGAATLFRVSRNCFYPRPDVDSAVIQIEPHACVDAPRAAYLRTVRGLFAMRRKTVLNNLRAGWNIDGDAAARILRKADIDPGARAEQLGKEDFASLARVLSEQ